MPARVSIGIVTWNSARDLERCLAAVRAQTHPAVDLLVVDNASSDGTRAILERLTSPSERILLDGNIGFAAAHNLAIARTGSEFYLALNADVFLSPTFVTCLAEELEHDDRVGSASGKLLGADGTGVIDSTGIYMLPSQRHLDRGQGEVDRGQYDRMELVFGTTAAAGFYRRAMLEDVAVDGEVFDQDFFAYREDADLAWRAQLLGWRCLYVPAATALHVRRVTPGRRAALPPEINRMSVRNRFLLRIKNQPVSQFVRFFGPAAWRDLQVVGFVLLREHASLGAFADVIRLLPRALRKRRAIMRRRRTPVAELNAWFRQRSRPFAASRPAS